MKRAYVPIADIDVIEGHSDGSLVAVDLMNGKILWRTKIPEGVCKGQPEQCSKALTAPSTVVNGVVFAAANDGVLRIYDTENGEVIWSYDTATTIACVNGLTGHVLYAFEIPGKDQN